MLPAPIAKIESVVCTVQKDFLLNRDRWRVLVQQGLQITDRGIIFDDVKYENIKGTFYRTSWGGPWHSGLIYEGGKPSVMNPASDINAAKALFGRLLSWKDANKEVGAGLLNNQAMFLRSRRMFRQQKAMRQHLASSVFSMDSDIFSLLIEYAYSPHIKRKLRIRFFAELIQQAKVCNLEHIIMSVQGKVKPEEWAKAMKLPRLVGDLAIGCILRGFLTKRLKKGLSTYKADGQHKIIFVNNCDYEVLKNGFEAIVNNRSGIVMMVFSDDACISMYDEQTGVTHFGDLDISTCDASHSGELFRYVIPMTPEGIARKLMRMLVQQCTTAITVKFHEAKVKLAPQEPVLYSGSTITTFINDIAQLCIFNSICANFRHCDFNHVGDFVKACSARAGYVVTFEDRTGNKHKLTFLKHFPNKDNEPILCLGTVFRSVYNAKRDVVGSSKIPLRKRCMSHSSGIMKGYCHSGDHAIYQSLAERFNEEGCAPIDVGFFTAQISESRTYNPEVSAEELCKRYDVEIRDIEQTVDAIKSWKFGEIFRTKLTSSALSLAYALDAPD